MQEKFFGINEEVKEVRTLIKTIQEHNDQCRELVGKDYALITVRRYESCKRYLAELIKLKYGKEDLPLPEVNGELVRAFEFYLKTEKECQQNTVIRYMKCLKKITNLALANEWITKDPFTGIKFHEKEVIREFPTLDELHRALGVLGADVHPRRASRLDAGGAGGGGQSLHLAGACAADAGGIVEIAAQAVQGIDRRTEGPADAVGKIAEGAVLGVVIGAVGPVEGGGVGKARAAAWAVQKAICRL